MGFFDKVQLLNYSTNEVFKHQLSTPFQCSNDQPGTYLHTELFMVLTVLKKDILRTFQTLIHHPAEHAENSSVGKNVCDKDEAVE